jgi:hypothetical protein
MRLELCAVALPVLMMTACASSPDPQASAMSNKGILTVAGLSPAQALGAIDTSKLVKGAAVGNDGEAASGTTNRTDLPEGQNGIAVEGVKPSDVLAAIDTSKLVDGDKTEPKP